MKLESELNKYLRTEYLVVELVERLDIRKDCFDGRIRRIVERTRHLVLFIPVARWHR